MNPLELEPLLSMAVQLAVLPIKAPTRPARPSWPCLPFRSGQQVSSKLPRSDQPCRRSDRDARLPDSRVTSTLVTGCRLPGKLVPELADF